MNRRMWCTSCGCEFVPSGAVDEVMECHCHGTSFTKRQSEVADIGKGTECPS